jgi:hypothetical protein
LESNDLSFIGSVVQDGEQAFEKLFTDWYGSLHMTMGRGYLKDTPAVKRKSRGERDTLTEAMKQVVRDIISDMVTEKIVRDKESFSWFGLDNTQFIVDGKPVADSLRVKFQAKFISPDGPGLYFGPVSIKGRGFFFSREDIYP